MKYMHFTNKQARLRGNRITHKRTLQATDFFYTIEPIGNCNKIWNCIVPSDSEIVYCRIFAMVTSQERTHSNVLDTAITNHRSKYLAFLCRFTQWHFEIHIWHSWVCNNIQFAQNALADKATKSQQYCIKTKIKQTVQSFLTIHTRTFGRSSQHRPTDVSDGMNR